MKTTKLKNIALFHGEQLEFINSATVYITDGVISKISDSASTTNGLINGIDSDYVEIDGDGFILIPAFVNAGIFVNNGVVDENINEAELEFNDLISEALNTSLRTGTIAASIILQNEKLNLSHLSEWKQDMCISVLDCESVVESAYYGRKRLQANGNGVVKKVISAVRVLT
ncbi:hypothetical protein HK098_002365 [Nowakowskiella sp. JEL0407]|nr:hypothetical protein HK098_002365 [Nowakowskiella sp. JEL0407]